MCCCQAEQGGILSDFLVAFRRERGKARLGCWEREERRGERENVMWTTTRKEGRMEGLSNEFTSIFNEQSKIPFRNRIKSISLLSAGRIYTDKALRLCSIIFHAMLTEYSKVLPLHYWFQWKFSGTLVHRIIVIPCSEIRFGFCLSRYFSFYFF